MTTTKTYSVIQRNPNSWTRTSKGDIHEIVNECGHKHKTVVAAMKCLRKLPLNSEFGYFGRIEDNQEGLPVEAIDADALYAAEIELRPR